MGALIVYIHLNISKIHHMETDLSRVITDQLRQIHHLLFRPLAGIRRRMKINGLDAHASLRHHITSYRTVYTARQQKHCLSTGSHGHSPWSFDAAHIHISPVADLNIYGNLRLMHVHFGAWHMVDDIRPGLPADLRARHHIILITSLGKYFEGKLPVSQFFLHMIHQFFAHSLKGLVLYQHHRTDMGNAKTFTELLDHLVKIIFTFCFYIDPAVFPLYKKFSLTLFQFLLYPIPEGIFKHISVFSLDPNL